MLNYKGFCIYYNDLQHKWHVVRGYELLNTCATLSGAKQSVTKNINNGNWE